jgi:hypothetical protein
VTVIFEVPTAAVLLAVNVSLELPLPGAAKEAGLKAAVTPVGRPVAESVTAELKPPLSVVETVVAPELPCATVKLAGEAATVKFGAVAAFIVTATTLV